MPCWTTWFAGIQRLDKFFQDLLDPMDRPDLPDPMEILDRTDKEVEPVHQVGFSLDSMK